jgi:anti-repressor protein
MEELIKVETNKEGETVVLARELHEFLIKDAKGGQKGRDFSHWIKEKIGYLDAKENQDYHILEYDINNNLIPIGKNGEPDNQAVRVQKKEYILTMDLAKQIAMVQNNDKGKLARLYFIECEKQMKAKQLPQTYKEALLELIAKEEEKEQLLLQVDNLSTALDSLVEWVSIVKSSQFNKVKENVFDWRILKKKSEDMGYSIKKAQSVRYTYQNLYHVNVFKACYPQFRYDFL